MHVIEHLYKASQTLFSFEIVPPARGGSGKEILEIVDTLQPLKPSWIDVTSHSAYQYFKERSDGIIEKRILKKRPGTLGICGVIQNRYNIDTVAHVLSLGFTREETEDALIELNFLGVNNVLALRGDSPNFQKVVPKNMSVNHFANELVSQISDLNKGIFLDEIDSAHPLDFCIGVAGYPEKHFEAASLKLDIQNLKRKVDSGAQYVVTQMFFDNKKYFDFVKQCRDAGINVPIIPGLKIIRSINQLKTIPKNFYIDLPDQLVDEIEENPKRCKEIGMAWALRQSEELMNAKVPSLHFYVLNDVEGVSSIMKKILS
jgi:methylenetetrahydrofolate reductase (NADPH)